MALLLARSLPLPTLLQRLTPLQKVPTLLPLTRWPLVKPLPTPLATLLLPVPTLLPVRLLPPPLLLAMPLLLLATLPTLLAPLRPLLRKK